MKYHFIGRTPRAAWLHTYQDAKEKSLAGDQEGAIQAYQEVLKTAPDKEFAAKTKILLAAAYLLRAGDSDQARGMQLYKDVASDYTVSGKTRVLAMNSIAWMVRRHDLSFYKLYFPEDPYASYIPATGDDSAKIQEVYLKLLQLSDTTYPNFYAEYLIAGSYYAPIIGQMLAKNTPASDPALVAAAQEADKYIKAGDSREDIGYVNQLIVDAYLNRATGLSASQGVLHTVPFAEREAAYQRVLDIAKTLSSVEQQNPMIAANLLSARFYYANFLLKFSDKPRTDDIVALLKPFAATQTPGIVPGSSFMKGQAKKLAALSPELKDYLTRTGYTY